MFVIGAIIGSFCYLLIERIPKGEQVIMGRSYCPYCKEKIAWYDLVPILSYLILRGECRHCKNSIGISSFVMECFSSYLCFNIYLITQDSLITIFYFSLIMLLVVISVIDWKTKCLYHCFLYPLFLLGLIYQYQIDSNIISCIVSMLSVSSVLVLFGCFIPGSVGLGDILLYCVLGMFLPFYGSYLALWIASSLGYFYGTIKKQKEIPFVPFICIGFLFTFLLI